MPLFLPSPLLLPAITLHRLRRGRNILIGFPHFKISHFKALYWNTSFEEKIQKKLRKYPLCPETPSWSFIVCQAIVRGFGFLEEHNRKRYGGGGIFKNKGGTDYVYIYMYTYRKINGKHSESQYLRVQNLWRVWTAGKDMWKCKYFRFDYWKHEYSQVTFRCLKMKI